MATQESKVTALPEQIVDDEQEASVEPEVEMVVTKEAKEEVNEKHKEDCNNEDMDVDRTKGDAESKDEGNEDCQEASKEDASKQKGKDEGRDDVQAEPHTAREQATPAEQVVVEEAPATTEPKTPAAKVPASRKKEKSAPKGPDLTAMALKITRLQDDASQIDAAIAANRKQIQELESKEITLTSEAQAKRQAAYKVSQEYTRKKCEVAIAKLEGDVPKKPLPAYIRFCMDHSWPGVPMQEQNKKRTEMWTNLADAEKKKYTDSYQAEVKRFREWGASEEGQKNHRERTELIRQIKATGEEELAKALGSNLDTPRTSPGKRSPKTSQDTPVKHRRVTLADPVFDDKVFAEAGKENLLAQLKNLASRPEVAALSKSSQELWDALKASNGMVNAAKRSLVGA